MPDVDNSTGQPDDIHAQIAQLRAQVETLMQDRGAPATEDAAMHAGTAICGCCSCCKAVRQHATEFCDLIRGQPLLAVLICAGVGFVLGRALR